MFMNHDPYIQVIEYGPDSKPKHAHRVIAWTEDGNPLIPGRKGLEQPRFNHWMLVDDDGPDYSDVERRARAALERLGGAGR